MFDESVISCILRYKGGPSLPRQMISVGDKQKHFSVEVFPLCLKLTDSRVQSEVVLKLSKKVLSQVYFRAFFVFTCVWLMHTKK